jgi:hypothetical protein
MTYYDDTENINDHDRYGDLDFLAERDHTIRDFRASEKETKHKIMEKMLELRHNKDYNKHLISVYMKAKDLFDTMVEEHRQQIHYLEEIYRHINNIIRENLSTPKLQNRAIIAELMKDKKRIGRLLKKMQNSYEKLSNVDTTIGVTIEKMDKIIELDDIQAREYADDGEDDDLDEDDDEDLDIDDDEDDDESDVEDDDEEYTSEDEDEDDDDDEDMDDDEDTDEDEDDDMDVDEDEDAEDEDDDAEDEDEKYAIEDEDEDENENENENDDDGIIAIY